MPLVYQQNINLATKLGVWHIVEPEDFFLKTVPLQREITHPNKRLQHLAGRCLLQELYPDFPYELIRIADTRKPFLENEAFHFSISHCGCYAAVMVSREQRVGVDVEMLTAKIEKIAHKFLSPAEQQLLGAVYENNPGLKMFVLTAAWSIKESLFKWYGSGQVDFIQHLHIDSFTLSDNEGIAHCSIHKNKPVHLTAHFLLFNHNCISWVMSG